MAIGIFLEMYHLWLVSDTTRLHLKSQKWDHTKRVLFANTAD